MQKPLFSVFFFACLLLVASSCSKSKDVDTPETLGDSWVVSYFQSDLDDAANASAFSGYTFEFNANNVLLVHQPNGLSLSGKWGVDAGTSELFMGVDNAPVPVSHLLGDWGVLEQTDTNLKLRQESAVAGAAGKTVHFDKQ